MACRKGKQNFHVPQQTAADKKLPQVQNHFLGVTAATDKQFDEVESFGSLSNEDERTPIEANNKQLIRSLKVVNMQ